ncbi:MAG: hypothetical protein U1F43_03340 [Myxococcota bacterium]
MTVVEHAAAVDAWNAVATAFAALGRVVLLLDNEYHVVRASRQLDEIVCAGTSERIIGKPVSALLGTRLFVVGDELHRALSQGIAPRAGAPSSTAARPARSSCR